MQSEREMKIETIAGWLTSSSDGFDSIEAAEDHIYAHANDGNTTYDSAIIAAGIARGRKRLGLPEAIA